LIPEPEGGGAVESEESFTEEEGGRHKRQRREKRGRGEREERKIVNGKSKGFVAIDVARRDNSQLLVSRGCGAEGQAPISAEPAVVAVLREDASKRDETRGIY